MSFRSKVGEEVYLSDEEIAEMLLYGKVWTIWTDKKHSDPNVRTYVISHQDVYESTNLLRKVEDVEDGIRVKPVVPLVFDDAFGTSDIIGTDFLLRIIMD